MLVTCRFQNINVSTYLVDVLQRRQVLASLAQLRPTKPYRQSSARPGARDLTGHTHSGVEFMSNGVPSTLFNEKGPFLLTVILATLGWGITHVTERFSNADTVEYRLETSPEPAADGTADLKEVNVTLHNLSLATTYYNRRFLLRKHQMSSLIFLTDMTDSRLSPDVVPDGTVWFGEEGQQRAIEPSSGRILYRIPQLPPDGRVTLTAYYRGTGQPLLQVHLDSESRETMRLVSASPETFIVRNETTLILQCLLAFTLGYLVLWNAQHPARKRITITLSVITALAALAPAFSYAANDPMIVVNRIHVVDITSQRGLAVNVMLMARPSKPSLFAEVDQSGRPRPVRPPRKCSPLWKLDADLDSDYIHVDDPQNCAPEITIRVKPVSVYSTEELIHDPRWVSPTGDDANLRHSRLHQIDTQNVNKLQVSWTTSTGVLRGHEGSPLVIGNPIYMHTPFPNVVLALNLKDLSFKWKYEPKQDADVVPMMCCDTVNRGLAYGDGKIFLQQADTTLVALDAKTGKVVWSVKNGNPKIGETNTNAPHIFKDKVLTGIVRSARAHVGL